MICVDIEVCFGCLLCCHVEFASSLLSFCSSAMPMAPLMGHSIMRRASGLDGGLKQWFRLFLCCHSFFDRFVEQVFLLPHHYMVSFVKGGYSVQAKGLLVNLEILESIKYHDRVIDRFIL